MVSLIRQCELLDLNRSSLYYAPAAEGPLNLLVMRLIDEQFTRTPFYGSRRMTAALRRLGYPVNRKRVQRLMGLMGLQAIYPRPYLSQGEPTSEKYPYLPAGLEIVRPDQVWSTDITYIRMRGGFLYLVAIMDWFSRYVLSFRASDTLDVSFCLEALEEALTYGTPEIFNSDQGSQFTSREFTDRLKQAAVRISMDSKGRVYDNIFVERVAFPRLKAYNPYPFQVVRADWFDRLAAPIRFYYDCRDLEEWLSQAKLDHPMVSATGLFGWRAYGERP